MNVHKGEMYRNKYKTIEEWMEKDRKLQEKYDNTPVPTNVKCQHCGGNMEMTIKSCLTPTPTSLICGLCLVALSAIKKDCT